MAEENALIKLINTIVPPRSLKVYDLTGKEHSCSAVLPATVQSRGIAALMEVMNSSVSDAIKPLIDAGSEDAGGQIDKMFTVIQALTADPDVLLKLSRVIDQTFPKVVAAAVANVQAEGIEIPTNPTAADVFEIDQVIALLSPFVLRLLKGLGTQMAAMIPQK